ncbi:MAG: CHAD domain-containing protein, partial [Elusimicrobia bacterium]|nr:CHAD domain-containing protein [Elusimicrobiota bacterium]
RGRALSLRARRAEARALRRGASLRRARAALGASPRGPGPEAFARAVAPALEARLDKAYRRGRRDFRAARDFPRKDRFHDLRKDSKELRHELEEAAPRSTAIGDLRRLGTILGEEHDLTMLRARLPRSADAAALRRLARRRRRRLRRRALVLAKGLFSKRRREDAIIGGP